MKGFIYGGLTALMLTVATGAMAEPLTQGRGQNLSTDSMVFNFNAPIITNSGVQNSVHFIRVAVIGMTLQDLVVMTPSQMEKYETVRVIDQSGKEVASKVSRSDRRVAITFDQPVAPGGYLQVEFGGVRMGSLSDNSLFYGVTGQRAGIQGEIPIGTARIQLPSRG